MTLGQRIQALRKEHDLSQEGLGEKLGVSRQAISRWEMDGAVPEVDKLIAMGKLFGVSVDHLLGVEAPAAEENAAAQAASGTANIRRWIALLAALLCLSLMFTGVLAWRLSQLEQQGQPSAALVPTLDPTAPLVATANFSYDHYHDTFDLTCNVTAAQAIPDLTVTLQVTEKSGRNEVQEMSHKGGSVWSHKLALSYRNLPLTVSAIFDDGQGGSYTQALFRINEINGGLCLYDTLWNQYPNLS